MDRQAVQERFGIIGTSDGVHRVIDQVRQVARTDISVLVEGESGVGKELVATAVHELSQRRHKPLVVVNCGAIPEGLIESELFGSEKGAFTGATTQRTGFFEQADGGTIFLDEIGEMPQQAQVRLLRVLESGQFSRVGSSQTLVTDARVVAATNKDLGEEVARGRFREDLYYRLSTVVLRIPPLRERAEDVLPIFEHFMARYAQQYSARMKQLDDSARALLTRYRWPGNVRELRNVAEQAVVMTPRPVLGADDLRGFLRGVSGSGGLGLARRDPADGMGQDASADQQLVYRALVDLRLEMRELSALVRHLAGGSPAAASQQSASGPALLPPAAVDLQPEEMAPEPYRPAEVDPVFYPESDSGSQTPDDEPFGVDVPFEVEEEPSSFSDFLPDTPELPTMEEAELALIREALRRFDGNRRQTSRALGISERTLYRKLRDLDEGGEEE
jgi:DNA-binding NtrC family response regulator